MEIPCCGFTCPVEATLRLVGGKYKAVILWHLMDAGTLRYHELHRRIPRATDKMLAQQLRELERDGLLRRIPRATDKMLAQQLRELERDGLLRRAVYPVVPPKTEYSLTDFGRSLAPILDEMCRWGEWYLAQSCSASSSQS
ncbi:MAG: helix-turn-helix domain-containing protein [Flavonifractor plautii]|uniref:winged helix-turn-helix transcriptional regulator n=1 Tax=uncultured Flavonifractor sp. TaxID=1193534 RepID=UPI0025980ED6|nr:helix-turn-helix domain-containing protein [uncultured Flavonifractor sp.]MDU3781645.1 helix-turn-helix domain-containing protein [Flavonifractor plautii]